MRLKKSSLSFYFRVEKNGKTVDKARTGSKRRFLHHIGRVMWRNKPLNVYLKVSYGRHLDNFGKKANFYNDGFYQTRKEFIKALRAFTERSLLKEFFKCQK